MASISLRTGLFAASLVAFAPSAEATMAVIDVKGLSAAQEQIAALKDQLGTLTDQLDTAKENLKVVTDQLDVLKEVKQTATETLSSIGQVGNLSIPSINFEQLKSSVTSDMSCLIPDYESLMPSIKFDDVEFGSICDRGDAYKSGLVATPASLTNSTWEEKAKIQKSIHANRVATITDATVKGLGQSDEAQETAATTLQTAEEYKSAGANATTVNDRLQVLIELNVAQLVTQAQTNQLLAQMLKIQASQALNNGVPVESDIAEDREYNTGPEE